MATTNTSRKTRAIRSDRQRVAIMRLLRTLEAEIMAVRLDSASHPSRKSAA